MVGRPSGPPVIYVLLMRLITLPLLNVWRVFRFFGTVHLPLDSGSLNLREPPVHFTGGPGPQIENFPRRRVRFV
jgi:hypothetical protein